MSLKCKLRLNLFFYRCPPFFLVRIGGQRYEKIELQQNISSTIVEIFSVCFVVGTVKGRFRKSKGRKKKFFRPFDKFFRRFIFPE